MQALLVQFSVVWLLLLPLAAVGALGVRYRQMGKAKRLGLVSRRAWLLLRWALALCAGFWLFNFISVFYEATLWPPLLAGLTVVVMVFLMRAARDGVHPGLYGFHWPFPQDGLELIERERLLAEQRPPLRWWIWRLAPVVPMAIVLLLPVMVEDRRWLIWLLLGIALLAPILLIPYKNTWLSPLLLLVVPGFLLWQAVNLRARLPPGTWVTPWTSAPCSADFVPAGDGTAWCVNVRLGQVYRYHLATGIVREIYQLSNVWEVSAADSQGAWIKERPAGSLVYVSQGEGQDIELGKANGSALTADRALWYLDTLRRLRVYDGQEASAPLLANEGLLTDPAHVVRVLSDQSVWVGTSRGVSRLDPETGSWQSYGPSEGIQGAVIDIAAAQDGTVWLLHNMLLNSRVWWASALQPTGEWAHYSMGRLSGLLVPRTTDAIAVDGLGRLWFLAGSISQREKFLGILNPDGTMATPMLSLGSYPTRGPFYQYGAGTLPGPYGLLADGSGGIYLYNGEKDPLRHWRP